MNKNFIIGIADQAYDLAGAVIIKPDYSATATRGGERRLTHNKTLDGGVVINDGGVSAGDKTMDIKLTSSRDLWSRLWALFETALWVTLATDEACYLAKIQRIKEADGKITLSVMVKECLSE